MPERRAVRSWQDAEHNAAAWMRYWGYLDARAKPGGADGGIDVWSARALGQVKYQAAAVGRPDLQRLFGARGRMRDRRLFFFTGSSYAAPAVGYALENDIALFVYGLDGSMEAHNAPARRVVEAARTAEATPGPEPVRSPPTTVPAPSARPHAVMATPPKKRHPGTSRLLLGLFLAAVAVFLPGSASFSPQPDRPLATAALLVIPCCLLVWGAVTRSSRRFWPTGLSLFLLDLPVAWAVNAQLWQGDASDLLLPTVPAVLCVATAALLLRWDARQRSGDRETGPHPKSGSRP
ncbi:hypothetical protein GCM10020227_28580 [Streptomyces flavovirens]|nr:restriction endonuclease [Streptomyces sp. MBT51]